MILPAPTILAGEALADPSQAGAYFSRKLRPLPHEVFACLFLDTRHRVIAYEELFRGTLDGSEVHPREVARAVEPRTRRRAGRIRDEPLRRELVAVGDLRPDADDLGDLPDAADAPAGTET